MPDEIPLWALDRAQQLSTEIGGGFATFHAFAAYIASKEEPPVDPLTEALRDANENGGCTYSDWAKALPEALAKRGLKIVASDQ